MKRVLLRTAAAMLVVAVIVTGLGVAAAQENGGVIPAGSSVPALAVEVPGDVRVGEQVTITVTDRGNGTAVEGASVYVWGLGWPAMAVFNADSFLSPRAFYFRALGETNGDGQVAHTFDRVGGFLILATREGYVPGLARLAVKPDLEGKLEIEAPTRAAANETVTIKVLEKRSGEAVPEADVWAVSLPRNASLSAVIPSLGDAKGSLEKLEAWCSGDITAALNDYGLPLGKTGADGVLEYTFTEVEGYLLVATKAEYLPGVKPIAIVADKALAVQGPRVASVGGNVTFTVTTRGTGTPVVGADLYALPIEALSSLAVDLRDTESADVYLQEKAAGSGEHLGTTDSMGQLEHQFSAEGIYIIVAIKDGYIPGVTAIAIGQFEILGQFRALREKLTRLDGLRGIFPQLPGLEEVLPRLRQFDERPGSRDILPHLWRFHERLQERFGQ